VAEDLKRKIPKVKQSVEDEEEEKKSNEELNKYEEIYAAQITSLQDLGFTDLNEIIAALRHSDGQLEQAIDFLFTK
jgi:Holliday junction resolvasome RuvABC DNA-binding subunit